MCSAKSNEFERQTTFNAVAKWTCWCVCARNILQLCRLNKKNRSEWRWCRISNRMTTTNGERRFDANPLNSEIHTRERIRYWHAEAKMMTVNFNYGFVFHLLEITLFGVAFWSSLFICHSNNSFIARPYFDAFAFQHFVVLFSLGCRWWFLGIRRKEKSEIVHQRNENDSLFVIVLFKSWRRPRCMFWDFVVSYVDVDSLRCNRMRTKSQRLPSKIVNLLPSEN